MNIEWLKNKEKNRFFPVTHLGAVLTNDGKSLESNMTGHEPMMELPSEADLPEYLENLLDLKSRINNEISRAINKERDIENLFSAPTDEAVDKWLREHPEATTSVQDNSLGTQKFTPEVREYLDGCNNMITSDKWSGEITYGINAYVIYDNCLWKCIQQHSGQIPEEGEFWTKCSVASELAELNSNFENLNGRSLDYQNYVTLSSPTYTPLKDGVFVVQCGNGTNSSALVKVGEFEQCRANGNGVFRGTANCAGFKNITYNLSWAGDNIALYFIPYK